MSDLIRDTVVGHILRFITGRRVLKYQEEIDPSLWEKYVHKEKSANMAVHGQTSPPEDAEQDQVKEKDIDNDQGEARRPQSSSRSSSATQVDENEKVNEVSGKKIDPEKGKDVFVVDWWGPNDPEVCHSTVRDRYAN